MKGTIIFFSLFFYFVLGTGLNNVAGAAEITVVSDTTDNSFEGFVIDAYTDEPLTGDIVVYFPNGYTLYGRVIRGYFRLEPQAGVKGGVVVEVIVRGYINERFSVAFGVHKSKVIRMMPTSSQTKLLRVLSGGINRTAYIRQDELK